MKGGKMNGQGKFVFKRNLFQYEGEWLHDKPHGKGIEISKDGCRYFGKFVDGLKEDDNAVYEWPNGIIYNGPFRKGFMEGLGRMKKEGGEGLYEG